MAEITIDESKLKELLKTAIVEVFKEQKKLFSDLLGEFLEEIVLEKAIRKGENTELTRRDVLPASSLMFSGIQIKQFNDIYLFRFTDELQTRSEELLERSKAGLLTPEEQAELASISELSRIFTFVNTKIAAQAKWSPEQLKQLYEDEPETSVNTAIPQNT